MQQSQPNRTEKEDHDKDNPALSKVIERNIRTIIHLRTKAARERGRRGLPLDELYRQLFNPQLYLLAYGRIYSNQGAMTPGVTPETVDGMSQRKIGRIIEVMRASGATRSLG